MSKITQVQDTRRIFIDTLDELAEKDDSIIVLTPDVGFNYLEGEHNFKVINTGVTEQATVALAAGMALQGMKPYVYSMINFVLFRPAEMVRNCVVNHNADVKLIGVKGSEKYKFLGFSHNMIHEREDFEFCRNMGLDFYGTEPESVRRVITNTYKQTKPYYIRL